MHALKELHLYLLHSCPAGQSRLRHRNLVKNSKMAENWLQNDELCEYCSQIEFSTLSLPTSHDLQLLRKGQNPPSRNLFAEANNPNTYMWSLGLQSRVNASSRTCQLCAAVCLLLQKRGATASSRPDGMKDLLCIAKVSNVGDVRPLKGEKWSGTKYVRLRRLSLQWRCLEEEELVELGQLSTRNENRYKPELELPQCFQTCDLGWKGERSDTVDEKSFCFAARPMCSLVDPEEILRNLEHCQHSHGDNCNGHLPSR